MLIQQQLVAIDNSRTLITSLLRHMASSSSSSSAAAAAAVQSDDKQMTVRHNDAAVLHQSGCNQVSSSSADNGHYSTVSVINDVMNVTSEDNHASFVNAVVAFVKVVLYFYATGLYFEFKNKPHLTSLLKTVLLIYFHVHNLSKTPRTDRRRSKNDPRLSMHICTYDLRSSLEPTRSKTGNWTGSNSSLQVYM